jgi:hypothetical protein
MLLLPMIGRHVAADGHRALQQQGDEEHQIEGEATHKIELSVERSDLRSKQ